MQTALSKIRTRFSGFISYDENRYTTDASLNSAQIICLR